jgi:hypothetical protein
MLNNLVVLRQEMKKIKKRDIMCIITKHEDFQANDKNIKLYASQHFCVLMSKGDPDYFFTIASAAGNADAEEEAIVPGEIQGIIELGFLEREDIELHGILSKLTMMMGKSELCFGASLLGKNQF